MPYKPELRFREYDCYKMYYCGVCRSIGRNFGQLPRMGLVNEAAALALILSFASGSASSPKIIRKRCIAHPYKKSAAVTDIYEIDYAAAVNVMLVYFKLLDSWHDDRNIAARTGAAALHNAFHKATKKYPIACDSIYFGLKRLSALESSACASIDEACEPFASIMSDIFMWKDSDVFATNTVLLDFLRKIGYNVGKWIYLIDAVCDFEKDQKSGSYNVLINRYGEKYDTEYVKFILEMCLAETAEAWKGIKHICFSENEYENINYLNILGTIENLFYIGMRVKTDKSCDSGFSEKKTNKNIESGGGVNGSV